MLPERKSAIYAPLEKVRRKATLIKTKAVA
jgi:hypothetical protein